MGGGGRGKGDVHGLGTKATQVRNKTASDQQIT